MIDFEKASLTEGHIARHTPTGSGAPGKEAAILISRRISFCHIWKTAEKWIMCL